MHYKLIKVGAHKGVDIKIQINEKDRCLFIEPVKELFDILVESLNNKYPNNRFVYLNQAASNSVGSLSLYVPEVNESGPSYLDQLSSVLPNHIKDHNLSFSSLKREVESTTLDSLIENNNITSIEYLIIDTEGHDKEVLDGLTYIKPDTIIFENKHIGGTFSKSKTQYKDTLTKLTNKGYMLKNENKDDTRMTTKLT
jgi:FkbM family methyltransferase